jgi:hypothetical protein
VIGPGRFCSMKLAGVVTPAVDAVTEYAPATVLAVNAALALPVASVVVVKLGIPPKFPLGPLAGAAKVTVAPLTGFANASATNATRGFANAILTVVLCPDPENTVIEAGEPATTLRVNNWVAFGGTPF